MWDLDCSPRWMRWLRGVASRRQRLLHVLAVASAGLLAIALRAAVDESAACRSHGSARDLGLRLVGGLPLGLALAWIVHAGVQLRRARSFPSMRVHRPRARTVMTCVGISILALAVVISNLAGSRHREAVWMCRADAAASERAERQAVSEAATLDTCRGLVGRNPGVEQLLRWQEDACSGDPLREPVWWAAIARRADACGLTINMACGRERLLIRGPCEHLVAPLQARWGNAGSDSDRLEANGLLAEAGWNGLHGSVFFDPSWQQRVCAVSVSEVPRSVGADSAQPQVQWSPVGDEARISP